MSSSFLCDVCSATLPDQAVACPGCGQALWKFSPSQAVTAGSNSILTQRYQILEEIGSGGFGLVYKARDRRSGRLVAIKQITLAALTAQEIIEATDSYNREITLLTKLQHKNLPRVYDHFTDPEHWYIVMEYIKGKTLEEMLTQSNEGRLPVKKVLHIGKALCDVLGYLHSQPPPIVFRDVKPANIMMTRRGKLYLIDFGIARRYRAEQTKDTGPLGSPGYAAPEQYGKAQTTPQTDIYGLGATLQTLVTGREPLEIRVGGLPPDDTTPPELQALITHMMERDTSNRPANMGEVRQRLQDLIKQLISPFRGFAILWCLLCLIAANIFFHSLVQMPFMLVMLCIMVGSIAYHFYKARRSFTTKEALAILNKNFSRSYYLLGYFMWSFIQPFGSLFSDFQMAIFLPLMTFLVIGIAGAFVIERGLFLKWWQWLKARRQGQGSAQTPPMQQQVQRRP